MSRQSESTSSAQLSRRGFIKGLGMGGAASGLLSPTSLRAAQAGPGGLIGPGEVAATLRVNGEDRVVNVEPRVTLLDALRNRLDITGPKKVCDRGTCGACTVLVDGQPAYACSMLALDAEGREITTVEGLGTPDKLNTVQRCFVDHDAQQCGFCTSGFIIAATAFVRKNPNATPEAINRALGGNLCRCGTYAGMLLAVADAARKGAA